MAQTARRAGGVRGPKDSAADGARTAAREASPWIERLARAGYAAKGVVYCLVGAFAVLAAVGRGGGTRGSKSALRSLLDEPFGQVLLGIIAIGLAGYALWCFVRATLDPEHERKVGKRVFAFVKGLIHVSLVVAVVGMILGSGSGSGGDDSGAEKWTRRLMGWPAGIWLVGIAGAAIAGYGLQQLYRAWTADLDDQLSLARLQPDTARWVRYVSRFGMAARGVVFGVIGAFLVLAAWRTDPEEAKGVADALTYLRDQPYGPWLLGAVALGLISYGIYEFVRARYRHIKPV